MSGEVLTLGLKAGVASPTTYHVPIGAPVRLITAASSTAKVEVSYDGGWTFSDWAFGTQAQSLTKEQRFSVPVIVRASAATGTATLEIDSPDGPPMMHVKGTPASVVAAPAGSVAQRYDGGEDTIVYVKETGTDASGWAPLVDAA